MAVLRLAATMGVICAAIGLVLQMPPALIGGAILSGVYFGDRCSPISTSALLTAELTDTNIFGNIRNMLRTAFVPFLISITLYTVIGLTTAHSDELIDVWDLFDTVFQLHWSALLPAVVILGMSMARFNVKISMCGSILMSLPICIFLQGASLPNLVRAAVFGYHAPDPVVAEMLNGGGIISMLRVAAIVCLSSAYAGIFEGTGL